MKHGSQIINLGRGEINEWQNLYKYALIEAKMYVYAILRIIEMVYSPI